MPTSLQKYSRPSSNIAQMQYPAQKHDVPGVNLRKFGGAILNLSMPIMGAEIMSIPYTVKKLGLILGMFVILLVSILTEYSVEIILRYSRAYNSTTYADFVEKVIGIGWYGRVGLQVLIVVNNISMFILYLIMIGDLFAGKETNAGILGKWFGENEWTTSRFCVIFPTLFLTIFLSKCRRADLLWRYTRRGSLFTTIIFVGLTAILIIVKLMEKRVGMPALLPEIPDEISFMELFTTFCIIIPAHICHHNVHRIKKRVEDPKQMRHIVISSLALRSCVYIMTSICGLVLGDQISSITSICGLVYGDQISDNSHSLLNDMIKVTYGIHLMLVSPDLFFSIRLDTSFPTSTILKRFIAFSTNPAAMCCILMVAIIGQSTIWVAFHFIASILLGFVFPAVIAFRDNNGVVTNKDLIVSTVLVFSPAYSITVGVCIYIHYILSTRQYGRF